MGSFIALAVRNGSILYARSLLCRGSDRMTVALLLGIGFAVGAILIATAFFPSPAPLVDALARLHDSPAVEMVRSPWHVRVFGESWQSSPLARRMLRGADADLRLCNLTP